MLLFFEGDYELILAFCAVAKGDVCVASLCNQPP